MAISTSIKLRTRSTTAAGILFVTPAALLYMVFTLGPLIAVIVFSFVNWTGIVPDQFAGIANYKRLLGSRLLSRDIFNAFLNNMWFFLGTLALQNSISLGLALLLHRRDVGKRFFQTVIATPFLVNPLVVGYAWMLLLNPTFGPAAEVMRLIGLGDGVRPWLGDPNMSRPIVILINAWQWIGFPMLIFLAALGSIPEEIYQAARLDRVSPRQSFIHITLPLLTPSIGTVALLTFIGCFNAFNLQYAIGGLNGGPGGANDVLSLVFYRLAFGDSLNAIGLSSALATGIFVFVFVVALLMRKSLSVLEKRVT